MVSLVPLYIYKIYDRILFLLVVKSKLTQFLLVRGGKVEKKEMNLRYGKSY